MKNLLKTITLFLIFGVIYCELEYIWRGHTDISMGIVGGLAGVIIGEWNEKTAFPLLP